jgi:hypothetical protein
MSMTWRTRPRETGGLPPATVKIYCDLTIGGARSGDGTIGNPYNYLRGDDASHGDVVGGVHICVRGPVTGLQFQRSGMPHRPIIIRGDEPGWGQGTIDGSKPVTMAPCATIGEAFGNPDWASLYRGELTTGLTDGEWVRPFYEDLDPTLLASFPAMVETTWEVKDLWALETYANSIWPETTWVPHSTGNPSAGSWNRSRSRIEIASHPGLAAALSAESVPILVIHVFPNVLRVVRLVRADSDGTPNPSGLFLVGAVPHLTSSQSFYAEGSRFLIANLPNQLSASRPGQVAFNHIASPPWVLASKRAPGGVISRSDDAALSYGFSLGKDNKHLWLHGFRIGGMSDKDNIRAGGPFRRVQRNEFMGSADMGNVGSLLALGEAGVILTDSVIQYNTFRKTWRQGQVAGESVRSEIRFNLLEGSGGTALSSSGAVYTALSAIRGNWIKDANGGHGNGLTLYSDMHGVQVVDNTVSDSTRPFTSEMGQGKTYDPTAPAAPSLLLSRNFFQRNLRDDSSWAVRFQEDVITGLTVTDNRIDGSTDGAGPIFGKAFRVVAGQTGTYTGNTILGVTSNTAPGSFEEPANTLENGVSPEADALRAAWAADLPHLHVSPGGVGHLGGY